MKNKARYLGGFIILCVSIPRISTAQFDNSTLVGKIWEHTTGTPDTLDWSASTLDNSGDWIVVGNTMVTATNTDMLITKYDPEGAVIWQEQYNHPNNSRDYGVSLAVDNSDNVYVAGTSITSTTNNYDWVIQKYNSSGTLQWEKIYNGPGSSYDVPTDMKVNNAGYLYVVGASMGTSTLSDYCTRKYNVSNGNLLWESRYDYTSLIDIPAAITLASNRVIVTGGSASSANNWDFATVKYNSSTGAQVTVTRNSSSGLGFDHPTAIAKDASDNIYVTGAAIVNGHFDIKTVKMDTALTTLWSTTWDNEGLNDEANSIGVDANGKVYVTGYTEKTNTGSDFITIKYNSAGTLQWEEFYAAPDATKEAVARKLDIDPFGDIFVAGDVYNIGNKDLLTLSYDTDGNKKWEEWYVGIGNGDDHVASVKVDVNNQLYVTGRIWTGSQYQYVTIKYKTVDYITPPDNEQCLNSLAFYENRGQVYGTDGNSNNSVKYYSINQYPRIFFQNTKISYVYSNFDTIYSTDDSLQRIDLSFPNSLSTQPYEISPSVNGYLNYLIGSDNITQVYGYHQLLYPDIYDEIDLLYGGYENGLKYFLVCDAGSRPQDIQLKYDGATSTTILGSGNLKVHSKLGDFIQNQPSAFQISTSGGVINLGWQPTYNSLGSNKYSLSFGNYDASKPLIIEIKYDGPASPTPGTLPKLVYLLRWWWGLVR